MPLKIDYACLILGRKFTVFLFFFFYLRAIPKYKPPGAYIGLEGGFNGGFLCYEFGGLIFGGTYTWRGIFSEFYCMRYLV